MFPDLVVQGPDGIHVFSGSRDGVFSSVQTIAADVPGSWSPDGGGRVGIIASILDDDYSTDVVSVSPGTDEVLVLLGNGDGTFADPVRYPSGADEPVALAVGNFTGDLFPDVAVGTLAT